MRCLYSTEVYVHTRSCLSIEDTSGTLIYIKYTWVHFKTKHGEIKQEESGGWLGQIVKSNNSDQVKLAKIITVKI